MFNRIISVKQKYVEPVYKSMTDDELLVLHSNTWNHLPVCKQMTDVKLNS